jgi:hypothetical protein
MLGETLELRDELGHRAIDIALRRTGIVENRSDPPGKIGDPCLDPRIDRRRSLDALGWVHGPS